MPTAVHVPVQAGPGDPGGIARSARAAEAADLAEVQVVADEAKELTPMPSLVLPILAWHGFSRGRVVHVEDADDVARLDVADEQVLLARRPAQPASRLPGRRLCSVFGVRAGIRPGFVDQGQGHRASARQTAALLGQVVGR